MTERSVPHRDHRLVPVHHQEEAAGVEQDRLNHSNLDLLIPLLLLTLVPVHHQEEVAGVEQDHLNHSDLDLLIPLLLLTRHLHRQRLEDLLLQMLVMEGRDLHRHRCRLRMNDKGKVEITGRLVLHQDQQLVRMRSVLHHLRRHPQLA